MSQCVKLVSCDDGQMIYTLWLGRSSVSNLAPGSSQVGWSFLGISHHTDGLPLQFILDDDGDDALSLDTNCRTISTL